MASKFKQLMEKLLRFQHVDPVEGIKQVDQSDDVRAFVAEVRHAFEERREERRPFELQWRLNQNFLAGNQYCDVLETTGEVVDYPTSYEWEMRSVYNQIAPITETRQSKLSRVQPSLTVRPVTTDTRDVISARLSTRLLKSQFSSHEMLALERLATAWSEICGGCFYKSVWDPTAGLMLGLVDGKPVHEGDVAVSVVPYYEIFPSSSYVESLDECDNVIHAKVYSVDEIKLRWGLDVEGRQLNTLSMDMSGMTPGGVGYNPGIMQVRDHVIDNAEQVLEYFEKPNRDFPEGRYAIIIGETLLHIGILPYRVGEHYRRGYPFAHQLCLENPGVLWGSSVIERCIPVQRDYNAVKNRINEYIARMTIGNMLVEVGSLVDDSVLDTGLPPGSVVQYKPGTTPPQWMTPQEIPATLLAQVDSLQEEFVSLSGVSEMSKTSQSPASISSGVALEILKEQDDTRLSLTAENIRDAVRRMGKQWLRLYKQFAVGSRVSRIAGVDAGDVSMVIWSNSDITSDDVVVDTDNEMTNTPAQRKQLALELMQVGLFSDPDTGRMTRETRAKLMEVFELGNWESAIDIDELHTARAQREALGLENGVAPQIMDLDNHTAHISEHIKFALGAEYRELEEKRPDMARAMLAHIEEHKQISVQRSMALAGAGGQATGMVATNNSSPEQAAQAASIQQGSLGGRPR